MSSLLNSIVKILTHNEIKHHENYDWSGFTHEDVNDVIFTLIEKKYSPKTINTYLSSMKGITKELKYQGIITEEQLKKVIEIKSKKGSHKVKGRNLSVDELNKLIDFCLHQDTLKSLRDATMIVLLYSAGLRRSEITNLTVNDYDPVTAKVKVVGKGNQARRLMINSRAVDLLNYWLYSASINKGTVFVRIHKGGHITNLPIGTQAVYNMIVDRYKEAGLKRLSPHDLRHSFATNLVLNGTGIKVIQELMGHANIQTTSLYTHISDEQKDDASKNLPI